jgi:hypothetical protein
MAIELIGENGETSGPAVKLSDANERLNDEMKTAFYDLAGFVEKELNVLRKVMKEMDNPAKLDEKRLAKLVKHFELRANRYAAAKDALRKGSLIVSPDVGLS